ncbi:MAG: endonuclease domain-containing protein [Alphaproteobacteria bacterium]|nr:endonuclease domain-containing protein [Alphaproteobacteria bacterium]
MRESKKRLVGILAYQNKNASSFARRLRKMDTNAEQLLWSALRARRLGGLKFVRQLPLGPFIADFACREHRLVIEVDGETHGDAGEAAYDQQRTNYLNSLGWRVVRCTNLDVYKNLAGVCDTILAALTS